MLLALSLAACQRDPQHFPHEAYIWQRQWTPAVSESLSVQKSQFTGWRVLALQVTGARVIATTPDLATLAAAALPVRLVVRIEGARSPLPVTTLWSELEPLLARWRAAGVDVAGVEIDHDCASAALHDYAQWLRELRRTLPATTSLSITALPTWMESPRLESLLAVVDASVLQVHAVQRPDRTLFDARDAGLWARAWATRAPHPFRVALPAYGVRIASDAQGKVGAVDAEGDIERSGSIGRELRADAREVAAFLEQMRVDPPQQLDGFVWFRLPVSSDRRSWSAATLAAVITGDALVANFAIEWRVHANRISDIWITNAGNLDGEPWMIELPADCRIADALAGYRLEIAESGLQLHPDSGTWLRSGERVRIGWARCTSADDLRQPLL